MASTIATCTGVSLLKKPVTHTAVLIGSGSSGYFSGITYSSSTGTPSGNNTYQALQIGLTPFQWSPYQGDPSYFDAPLGTATFFAVTDELPVVIYLREAVLITAVNGIIDGDLSYAYSEVALLYNTDQYPDEVYVTITSSGTSPISGEFQSNETILVATSPDNMSGDQPGYLVVYRSVNYPVASGGAFLDGSLASYGQYLQLFQQVANDDSSSLTLTYNVVVGQPE